MTTPDTPTYLVHMSTPDSPTYLVHMDPHLIHLLIWSICVLTFVKIIPHECQGIRVLSEYHHQLDNSGSE